MKDRDFELLSLHLDGRLRGPARERLEQRLASEPALRGRLAELRSLQAASEALARPEAAFGGAQVLARAEARPARSWRPWAAAAAAVLALAVTHGGAYLLGAKRGVESVAPSPLERAERVFERAANLDPAAPHDVLRAELGDLEEQVRGLPPQLIAYAERGAAEPQRHRALELHHVLLDLQPAFEVRDPGFAGMLVVATARQSLQGATVRALPGTTSRYARVEPLESGRVRLILVHAGGDEPRLLTDEGTPAELEERHPDIVFVKEGD